MSYLLTEIALEMLGYKYYDIYGVPDDINNFQNLAASDRTTDGSNEPHLDTILGVDTRNAKRSTSTNHLLINLPEEVTKLMDLEYNKVRQQFLRNKLSLTEEYLDPKAMQAKIQYHQESEYDKLTAEKNNLQNFRRVVEDNLRYIKPASFEKHLNGFKNANTSTTFKTGHP
ncbi:uncharacterized protein LOC142225463 [Haematobia irritans]|uniref:uncharacterized protein LOC142225463 n=1 Tax=Haematobia irritans TaxID=7368 RepID=UPI003F5005A6